MPVLEPLIDAISSAHRKAGPGQPVARLYRNTSLKEIPSLAGLRAFASLSVVMCHVVSPLFPGREAVTLFFVLSGFLITLGLLRQLERSRSIDIVGFYVRRARRLLPAYYVWLVLVVLLMTGRVTSEITAAAVYLSDYYAVWVRQGMISHIWSLSVEEQFYLAWPAALLFLSGFRSNVRYRVLFLTIGAVQLVRLFLGARFPLYFYYAFEVRLDALLLGCAMAIWLKEERPVPEFLLTRWSWVIPVIVLGGSGFLPPFWQTSIINTLAAWCAAALIARAIASPPAILNNRVTSALGAWSYSLYLYHVLVRWAYMRLVPGATDNSFVVHGWVNRIAVILLSVAAAWASYRFVERPYLRRRPEHATMATPLAATSA